MGRQYVNIADALNPAVECKRTINLFGVVVDCRAPCTTNGTDLRSEIAIADESCVLPEANLKRLFVHSFVSDPSQAIPFRQLGDVVRIHKATLIDYARYGETAVRQGRIKFYSTILLWKHDAIDFEPISLPHLLQGVNVKHVSPLAPVDRADRLRITALRKWTHDFFFTHYQSQRPYLRTVSEILNAPNDSIMLSKNFDMVCFVNQTPVVDAEDNLVMTASNAATCLRPNIRVSSQPPSQTGRFVPRFKFVDFCPSWNVRPTNGSWLLIRDARVVDHGRGREIQLSVGGKTSTLIWSAHNAPDVRVARERCSVQHPNAHPHSNAHAHPNAYSHPNAHSYRNAQPQSSLHPSPNAHPHQNVTARDAVPERAPVQHTPKRSRTSAASDERHAPRKVPRYDRAPAAFPSENNLLQNGSGPPNSRGVQPSIATNAAMKPAARADHHLEIRPAPPAPSSHAPDLQQHHGKMLPPGVVPNFPRTDEAPLGIQLAPHEKLVTAHDRSDRRVWRISNMVDAFRNGCGQKLFRLAVWARGIAWPRDLRHACRPICAKCESGVLMVGNNCDNCGWGAKQWQFMLRLVLEERCAGAAIESWVTGKDAERLLGMQASDLRVDDQKCDTLKHKLRTLHAAISVVDCLVVPFEYEDNVGSYRVACVMKGTRMLN